MAFPSHRTFWNAGLQSRRQNRVWAGDITYVWTQEGWLYLAVVIDLLSRQVVGFAMSDRMTRQLVIDALRMAWFRRRPTNGLIFHSDRGSQPGFNQSSQQSCELTVRARQMPLQVFSSQGFCEASC